MISRHLPHRYGWYIRHGYGTYAIRNKREAEALYEFCKEQLADMAKHNSLRLNPERVEVYKNTIEIYHNASRVGLGTSTLRSFTKCGCGHCRSEWPCWDFYNYTNDHAGWYWS